MIVCVVCVCGQFNFEYRIRLWVLTKMKMASKLYWTVIPIASTRKVIFDYGYFVCLCVFSNKH